MKTNDTDKEELNLATIVSEYGDEDSARALLESLRWPSGAVCPHCESFFSLFRRGVTGAFHHISNQHLHRYADEFSFRWNTRKLTDGERFETAIPLTVGKRLKLRETVASV
jgi:hypothetical protein